jgi:hypothetical protein
MLAVFALEVCRWHSHAGAKWYSKQAARENELATMFFKPEFIRPILLVILSCPKFAHVPQ